MKFKRRGIREILALLGIIIVMMGIFLFPYYVRGVFVTGNIQSINFLGFAGVIVTFLAGLKYLKKERLLTFILIILLSVVFIKSQQSVGKSTGEDILYYLSIIFPLLLITVDISKLNFESKFRIFLKGFDLVIVILLVLGLIDQFTDNSVAKYLALHFNNDLFSQWAYTNYEKRYVSFMGHPLNNTLLFIEFFVFNNLNNKYFKKLLSPIIITIIATLGVAITGSKSGLVIIVCGIASMYYYEKRILITQVVVFILASCAGVFNNTIMRLMNGSLTTGRSEIWSAIKEGNLYPFQFFKGYGSGFTYIFNSQFRFASAAFEYPFRMFSLEYGELFTIIFYSIIFIIPMIIFLKRKQLYIIIGYLAVMIDANTYNGIGVMQDNMLILAFMIFFMLNLSRYIDITNQLKSLVK